MLLLWQEAEGLVWPVCVCVCDYECTAAETLQAAFAGCRGLRRTPEGRLSQLTGRPVRNESPARASMRRKWSEEAVGVRHWLIHHAAQTGICLFPVFSIRFRSHD